MPVLTYGDILVPRENVEVRDARVYPEELLKPLPGEITAGRRTDELKARVPMLLTAVPATALPATPLISNGKNCPSAGVGQILINSKQPANNNTFFNISKNLPLSNKTNNFPGG